MSRHKVAPREINLRTYYWRVWLEGDGIINSGSFESENMRKAKQLATDASDRNWDSDWQSEGCTIQGAKSVAWMSDLDHRKREVILFVYEME